MTNSEFKKEFYEAIEHGIHPADHACCVLGGVDHEKGEPFLCVLIDGNVSLDNFVKAAKVVEKYLENKAP